MRHAGMVAREAYGEEQKPLCAWTLPAPALEAEPLGADMHVAVEVPQDPSPDLTVEAVFASERQSAARARSFVSGRLVDHRLLRLVDPVRAVTSELSTNAIVHARTPFTVTLSRNGPVVLLSVEDAAPDSPAVRCSVQVMADGGYGLNLVASLSRAWGVTISANHSKSVWASFDIRPHGEGGWC